MVPCTIKEEIDSVRVSTAHRRVNGTLLLNDVVAKRKLSVPINPLISKYKDYVDKYVVTVDLTEDEVNRYRFAPKKFAMDIYGDVGYWSMLLFLNECHSITDFNLTSIKYIDPNHIEDVLEEIFTLEGVNI